LSAACAFSALLQKSEAAAISSISFSFLSRAGTSKIPPERLDALL
jgi:hypothetical protein